MITPLTASEVRPPELTGEPVWELAYLFPNQGGWSEEEYLALETNLLIEFTDGYLEVLPMPTMAHQFIVLYLYGLLNRFVQTNGFGWVLVAPVPVRLSSRVYREPDIVFLSAEHPERREGDYPYGADLVMEVVSSGQKSRQRDFVRKRKEYAQAGVAEYWIVDPEEWMITVLELFGEEYRVYGRFSRGEEAISTLLQGFRVNVDDVFNAARQ
jgi:Uma2 family endonuclease